MGGECHVCRAQGLPLTEMTVPALRGAAAGLGLGATPVALANMDAITKHYGPSAKAFIVIPLIGAFFIDLLNAGVIQFFIDSLKDFDIGP